MVLEGAPVFVDDRVLVVGVTLEDNDPFRVVELCGVPLVRFLFDTNQGTPFSLWRSSHTIS